MKKFMYEAPAAEVVEMEVQGVIMEPSPSDGGTSEPGGGLD